MPDTPPSGKPAVKPSGNFLTQKMGPLPTWAWGAIVLAAALAYALYKQRKDAAATTAASTSSTANPTPGSALTPAVIVQNYNPASPTPPTAATPAAAPASVLVAVPNVANMSAGQAHNALVAANLVPTAPAAQKPNMKASGTNPAAGTQVPKGSKVTIQTSGYVGKSTSNPHAVTGGEVT